MEKHRVTDTDYDSLKEAEKRHRLVRFDPKIDSGTIIQILVLIVGGAFGYAKIETALALGNQRTDAIEKRTAEQDQRTNAALLEMKQDIKETGQKVQDLKTKIDLLDLKVSQPRVTR